MEIIMISLMKSLIENVTYIYPPAPLGATRLLACTAITVPVGDSLVSSRAKPSVLSLCRDHDTFVRLANDFDGCIFLWGFYMGFYNNFYLF